MYLPNDGNDKLVGVVCISEVRMENPTPKQTRKGWTAAARLGTSITLLLVGVSIGAWFFSDWSASVLADKHEKASTVKPRDDKKDKKKSEGSKLEADPDIALAMRLERAFKKVARHVAPSVVSLTVFSRGGDWNEQLWKMHQRLGPRNLEREFTGSGVIIRADGTILTNEHVVRDAAHIRATLHDATAFTVKVVGTDPRSDLAVLSPIEGTQLGKKLIPASFADSDTVQKGQWALAVGNPFKLSNTLTVGVVSERGRSLTTHRFFSDVFYGDLIQTDAATNPGNSGGPLFNIRGQLIGINTMIYSKSGKFEGFGFAIPSNQVKPRLAFLELGRPVQYGWLGVALKNLERDQRAFDLPQGAGVLVQEVFRNMPADRAGMKRGSVILSFDDIPVRSADELIMAVGMAKVGKKSRVRLRDPSGKITELAVRIGLRTRDIVQLSRESGFPPDSKPNEEDRAGEFTWRGMRIREMTAEEAKRLGGRLRVIGVLKGSPADRAGLYEGAILSEIKYAGAAAIKKLASLSQLERIAKAAKGPVYLHASVVGYVQLDPQSRP